MMTICNTSSVDSKHHNCNEHRTMMKILICLIICEVANSLPSAQKVGVIYKGPGSSIIIEGPDGSVIKADATGGSVSVGDVPNIDFPASGVSVSTAGAPSTEELTTSDVSVSTAGPSSTEELATSEVSGSTGGPTSTADADNEVDDTPSETTKSDEDAVTPPAVESTSNVELIEPLTISPAEVEDVDLEGPSGRIFVSGSRIVVAGPASVLIKETGRNNKGQEPAKETETVRRRKLALKHSSGASLRNQIQQRPLPLLPAFAGNSVRNNLVMPGFPFILDPFQSQRFLH